MTEFPTKKSLIDLRDPRVVCHETIVPENQLLLEDTQELSPVGKKNLDAIDFTKAKTYFQKTQVITILTRI